MGFFGAFTTKTLALDVHSDMGNIELFFQSLRVSLIAPPTWRGQPCFPYGSVVQNKTCVQLAEQLKRIHISDANE